jgi:hypothetical protein
VIFDEGLVAGLYSACCRPSLRALMEFARNVLICRAYFEHQNPIRFAFLRSDLSCHHIFIYLRNLSMCTAKLQLLLYAAFSRTWFF